MEENERQESDAYSLNVTSTELTDCDAEVLGVGTPFRAKRKPSDGVSDEIVPNRKRTVENASAERELNCLAGGDRVSNSRKPSHSASFQNTLESDWTNISSEEVQNHSSVGIITSISEEEEEDVKNSSSLKSQKFKISSGKKQMGSDSTEYRKINKIQSAATISSPGKVRFSPVAYHSHSTNQLFENRDSGYGDVNEILQQLKDAVASVEDNADKMDEDEEPSITQVISQAEKLENTFELILIEIKKKRKRTDSEVKAEYRDSHSFLEEPFAKIPSNDSALKLPELDGDGRSSAGGFSLSSRIPNGMTVYDSQLNLPGLQPTRARGESSMTRSSASNMRFGLPLFEIHEAGFKAANGFYFESEPFRGCLSFVNGNDTGMVLHKHHKIDTIWCLSDGLPSETFATFYECETQEHDHDPPEEGWVAKDKEWGTPPRVYRVNEPSGFTSKPSSMLSAEAPRHRRKSTVMSVEFMNDVGVNSTNANHAKYMQSIKQHRLKTKFGRMASQQDLYVNISEAPILGNVPSFDVLGSRDLPGHHRRTSTILSRPHRHASVTSRPIRKNGARELIKWNTSVEIGREAARKKDVGLEAFKHASFGVSTSASSLHAKCISILDKKPITRVKQDLDVLTRYITNWLGFPRHRSKELAKHGRLKSLKKDEILFKEGDKADKVYVIITGEIKIIVNGKEKNRLGRCDYFGEVGIVQGQKRSAGTQAACECDLIVIPAEKYTMCFSHSATASLNKEYERVAYKDNKLLPKETRITKACMFIDDALHHRPLKLHRVGKWPQYVHRLLNNSKFVAFMMFIVVINMTLAFWEPPSRMDQNEGKWKNSTMIFIGVEWALLFFHMMECGLRLYSFGKRWFFDYNKHRLRVLLILIVFLDLTIASATDAKYLRFSRPIRPLFLFCHSSTLTLVYRSVGTAMSSVFELLLFYLIVLVFFAQVGHQLFWYCEDLYVEEKFLSGDTDLYPKLKQSLNGEQCSTDSIGNPCDLPSWVFTSFSTSIYSALSLFVLSTSENYPDVMLPAYMNSYNYFFFYLAFILWANIFFLNLLLVFICEVNGDIMASLLQEDADHEVKALSVAWKCLDVGDHGNITRDLFFAVMSKMRSDYDEKQLGVLFSVVNVSGNNLISEAEWQGLPDAFYVAVEIHENADKHTNANPKLSKLRNLVYTIIVLLDCVSLVLYHSATTVFRRMNFLLVCCLLGIHLSDLIYLRDSLRMRYYIRERKLLLFLLAIETAGSVVNFMDEKNPATCLIYFGIFRIFDVFFLIAKDFSNRNQWIYESGIDPRELSGRLGLFYSFILRANKLFRAMLEILPFFLFVCIALFSELFYIYVILGMELFSGNGNAGEDRCSGVGYLEHEQDFCSFRAGTVTLLQVITTSNWHEIMYGAMESHEGIYVWAGIYFVSFYVIGPLIMMALVTSVFINLFLNQAMSSAGNLNLQEFFSRQQDQDVEMQDNGDNVESVSARTSLITPTTPRGSRGHGTVSIHKRSVDGNIDEIVVSLKNTIGRWRRNLQRSVRAKNEERVQRQSTMNSGNLRISQKYGVLDELYSTGTSPSLLTSMNTGHGKDLIGIG